MGSLANEKTCRICFKIQVTVYSLFRKQKGIYPHEKLKKLGVKASINDARPQCICCNCLNELDITVKFLEKCEKSNEILTAQLYHGFGFFEQNISFKDDISIHHENNANYLENLDIDQEANVESVIEKLPKNNDNNIVGLEEPQCGECGSKRRCQHWAPPSTHTCPYCQKVFNRKFNFKLHLARHSGSREWACRLCGAGAVSRWLAAAHCAPRARRVCPAPGCGKSYTSRTNLDTHLRVHSGERPFECNDCGKTFTSKNTLSDHMRIHTGALPYMCSVCGRRFRTNKLAAHAATHAACARAPRARRRPRPAPSSPHASPAPPSPAPAPSHACALCPARYRHRQSLNKHVRKQHAQKSSSTAVDQTKCCQRNSM